MIKFIQKLDRNNKVYIAKPLRQAGLVNTLEIVPRITRQDLTIIGESVEAGSSQMLRKARPSLILVKRFSEHEGLKEINLIRRLA